MQKTKGSLFDPIAEAYYTFTPTLPEQYITLIQKTFNIQPADHIIDLGCGSGDLALSLAKYSSFVEGIDISKKMVEMAKEKDLQKQVAWTHIPVEKFDLGEERYDLIITFDSFHLFSDPVALIKRCARALKPGGSLCVGWVMYAFDPPLRNALEETFAAHGLPWDDWGAWTCPDFSNQVKEANVGLSSSKAKSVEIPARVSTKAILNYNFNVSKTASLDKESKQKIAQTYWERISAIYPSGKSVGFDRYSIQYTKK